MKRRFAAFLVLAGTFFTSITAQATPSYTSTVDYDANSGRGQYNYTIINDLSDKIITEFTVDFYGALYDSLRIESSPAGWFTGSYDPVLSTTVGFSDGFFLAIADPGSGVGPLATLSGFSVSFDWYGEGIPLDNDGQAFSYVAVSSPAEPVPEPGTFLLLGAGLAGLAAFRRIYRNRPYACR